MKKIVTDDRYEEHGSPVCWAWVFIGAMWLVQLFLYTEEEGSWIQLAAYGLLAAGSFLSAWSWTKYLLIADESGIRLREGGKTRTMTWPEIARVTVHNKVSFWKATGLTFHPADPDRKPLYINKEDLLPLVKRYAACPIEENK